MGHKKRTAGYGTANKHAINNGHYVWEYKFTFDILDGDEAVERKIFCRDLNYINQTHHHSLHNIYIIVVTM